MIFPVGVSKFKRTGLDKLTNSLILWVSILTDAGMLFFRQVVIWFNFIVVQKMYVSFILKNAFSWKLPSPPSLPPPKKKRLFWEDERLDWTSKAKPVY